MSNTASVAKTREPKDEQLCNAVYIHNIHIHDTKTPKHINKISNNKETTVLHKMRFFWDLKAEGEIPNYSKYY